MSVSFALLGPKPLRRRLFPGFHCAQQMKLLRSLRLTMAGKMCTWCRARPACQLFRAGCVLLFATTRCRQCSWLKGLLEVWLKRLEQLLECLLGPELQQTQLWLLALSMWQLRLLLLRSVWLLLLPPVWLLARLCMPMLELSWWPLCFLRQGRIGHR